MKALTDEQIQKLVTLLKSKPKPKRELCPKCGKPLNGHRHMTAKRLTQFSMLSDDEIDAQLRRAYGRFVPGSPARQNRAEAWMRGETTCEHCGRARNPKNKRYCSVKCRTEALGSKFWDER